MNSLKLLNVLIGLCFKNKQKKTSIFYIVMVLIQLVLHFETLSTLIVKCWKGLKVALERACFSKNTANLQGIFLFVGRPGNRCQSRER